MANTARFLDRKVSGFSWFRLIASSTSPETQAPSHGSDPALWFNRNLLSATEAWELGSKAPPGYFHLHDTGTKVSSDQGIDELKAS